jgi:FtsP/CotA-like multicopper oxidase with cupredoxin domain
VHNFHIHQNKFQIAPCSAAGCTAGGPAIHTLEAVDQVNVVQTLIESETSPNRPFPLHDTIIVPRGIQGECEAASIGTGSGSFLRRTAIFDDGHPSYNYVRSAGCKIDPTDKAAPAGWIEVTIPFTRAESVGKYVFHCHILEHEDKGMMASIRVLTNEQLAASMQRPQ